MAKSAKIKTRKPISTVTLLAWGLLALATAFDHIPSFRAAALILYAVDWLAIAIAATLTKRKICRYRRYQAYRLREDTYGYMYR